MLEVQKYLQGGKSLADLNSELGINSVVHPELPLVILNYDQIESPKTHPIVRECRALVLNTNDWSLAARSFSRFFNWGEVADEMKDFDFSNFFVQSKEDGSLCVIYYFNNEWHANTRGSFALDNMQLQSFSWREGFCKALGISSLSSLKGKLNEKYTYICEFCSPWNKIVRKYTEPVMYLLTAFDGYNELDRATCDNLVQGLFKRPEVFEFTSIEQIQEFLTEQSAKDATFEGVVIRDCHGHRWKVKSASYIALHSLRGESGNLFNPKHLLPFVMAGEQAELLCYFPEVGHLKFFLHNRRLQNH